MTKIIELAHQLGIEIANSEEIRVLNETKNAFDSDADLQSLMSEYEADRMLLGQEFAKDSDADQTVISNLKERLEELSRIITANANYAELDI